MTKTDTDARVERLRAELELAELEQELVAAKKAKDGALAEIKNDVRAARQAYRETRED